jgi:hypothetical protein
VQISRAHGYAPLHRIILHQRDLPLSVRSSSPFDLLTSSSTRASPTSGSPHSPSRSQPSSDRLGHWSPSLPAWPSLTPRQHSLESPLSLENEREAVSLLIREIREKYASHPTTEEEDEALLSSLHEAVSLQSQSPSHEPTVNWNLTTAVTSRLLRKRIMSSTLRGLNLVLVWIDSFLLERENVSLPPAIPPLADLPRGPRMGPRQKKLWSQTSRRLWRRSIDSTSTSLWRRWLAICGSFVR